MEDIKEFKFVGFGFVTLAAPLPVAIVADGPWLTREPLCFGVEASRFSFSTLATPHWNALLAPARCIWLLPFICWKFIGVTARITRAACFASGALKANSSCQDQIPLRGCESGRWLLFAAPTTYSGSRIFFLGRNHESCTWYQLPSNL